MKPVKLIQIIERLTGLQSIPLTTTGRHFILPVTDSAIFTHPSCKRERVKPKYPFKELTKTVRPNAYIR